MMSGRDHSEEIGKHLKNWSTMTDKVQMEASEAMAMIEPLYKNKLWKGRLHRIKRDGHGGHYDCGPNYFSIFPFFIFIQSFATTVVNVININNNNNNSTAFLSRDPVSALCNEATFNLMGGDWWP